MKATELKGVYNLNPTQMVMKQGRRAARLELSRPGPTRVGGTRMPLAHEAAADTACIECADMSHPAMQTRASHPKNLKMADGRKHEDQHSAVKHLKGKM